MAHNITLATYTKAKSLGIDTFGIEDGYVTYIGGKYRILYNDEAHPTRTRWTIAHELGHILLGHLLNEKREYEAEEAEANYFAKQLLMPLATLDKLGARTAKEISTACDVSMEAASIRAAAFARRDKFKAKYGNTRHDLQFLKQFAQMFDFDVEMASEIALFIAIAA